MTSYSKSGFWETKDNSKRPVSLINKAAIKLSQSYINLSINILFN